MEQKAISLGFEGAPVAASTPVVLPHLSVEKTRPWLTVLFLLVTDLATLTGVLALAITVRHSIDGTLWLASYWNSWPILCFFPVVYAGLRLYPVVGFSPAEELRRLTYGTTTVFLALGMLVFLSQDYWIYSRAVFLASWILAVIALPLARAFTRYAFSHQGWWGYPVVVMGAGHTGDMVVRALLRQPSLGLRPVAVLDDDPAKHGTLCGAPVQQVRRDDAKPRSRTHAGLPVLGGLSLAPLLARQEKIPYAILAMPGVPHRDLLNLIEQHGHTFPQLIVVPDLFGFASLQVPAADLGGILGVQMRQRLLHPIPCFLKRSMDLVLTIVGGLLALPFLLLIGLLIRLESKGPAIFFQRRPGRDGRFFRICKFRTMHVDAEERFNALPQELKDEFKQFGKIKNDPRVTLMGRFLRKTSFDELPQLWNVLKGEMSLVGPRAYLIDQTTQMTGSHAIIFKVRPGITGFWQVSGRSETTFGERLELDAYYTRNWSVWLDLYILARTVSVVLKGSGAY